MDVNISSEPLKTDHLKVVGLFTELLITEKLVPSHTLFLSIEKMATGRVPEKIGNRYESTYPYDSFKVKDGSIVIACGNDKLFSILANEMSKPELVSDERFVKNIDRVTNHAELKEIIEKWSINYTIDDLVDRLLELGIPTAPINTIDRIVKDPHIAGAREMFVEVDHPIAGKNKITGNHIKFNDLKADIRMPAPVLGQHNDEIYSEVLGFSKEKIQELRDNKII